MKVTIELWTCDGCGKRAEMPNEPRSEADALPPGWTQWTVTDWAHMRHGPGQVDVADRASVMLHVHEPACAKKAMAAFVDRAYAEPAGVSEIESMVGVPI